MSHFADISAASQHSDHVNNSAYDRRTLDSCSEMFVVESLPLRVECSQRLCCDKATRADHQE